MIKFKSMRPDGTPLLGFGLSAENVERLKAGSPIFVDLAEMGEKGAVAIFYGETEGDLIETLQPYIGSDTQVHDQLEDPGADKRVIAPEMIDLLSKLGYRVVKVARGWSCRSPRGFSVIRGWAKTEAEGWWFCWKHARKMP
ncbi:MAG: hypothetical protein L0Z53_15050 [Acidobacteriales bacterium]|nr:hypothetical protein [Terriglobales bacterium]